MNSPAIELPFFTNLLILLVAAKLLGEIFERFKHPAMIGEIIAGALLGPTFMNLIHRSEDIKVISELGVFLLVIQAGLEINADMIMQSVRGRKIMVAIMAFFIPNFLGVWVGYLFKLNVLSMLFIGLCVSITALPVSVRILMDLGKINTEIGQRIISAAIFDDILALAVLGVLLSIKDTDLSIYTVTKAGAISMAKLLLLISILIFSFLLFKKITNRGNYLEDSLNKLISILKGKEPLFAIFFAYILLFSTISESMGFHFIIGAFFASLLINEKIIGQTNIHSIEKTIRNISMGFLAPIFFAGIGLEFNIHSIQNILFLIAIIAVSYISKITGGFIGGKLAGYDNRTSLTLGMGLNARGIMELIIANIAYKNGLINSEIFSVLVIMGLVTTLTTPYLLKKIF
ncbi:MAG: cation:proton antiporter [Bacteroidia bacterium]|nr:cation:proton antiporter [Bacteroidia bacterium]